MIRAALKVALEYGGAVQLRDLLSSSRLLRLASDVMRELHAAERAEIEDATWYANAAQRLGGMNGV